MAKFTPTCELIAPRRGNSLNKNVRVFELAKFTPYLRGDCPGKRQHFGKLVKFVILLPSPGAGSITGLLLSQLEDPEIGYDKIKLGTGGK